MTDRDSEAGVQTDYLRGQLESLRRNRKLWLRFRLLEWVCRACGETVLEVIDTDQYRVYLSRRRVADRAGREWSFDPIPQVRPYDAERIKIRCLCRCRNRMLTESMLWDDLDGGKKKRVLS